MKKLVNRPEDVLAEMMEGLCLLNPSLARLAGVPVLVRADAGDVKHRQVALISGGGSGHEPAHAGYIGAGMLSAAVLGQVFTSPTTEAVLAAIRCVAGEPGVLLIIKNYTGDRLNFGLAAELARAEGIPVESVIVADDVALSEAGDTAGARGLAGTVFVHKIAGAAAAEGRSLHEVSQIARSAAGQIATMGLSLTAGTSPATGKPSFLLNEKEIELGLGIHGEPGIRRAEMQPADELVNALMQSILAKGGFAPGQRLALLVNGLGATTPMELAICARAAVAAARDRRFAVERLYAGTFLSSLDMAGISVSAMAVDEDRLRWLDASTTAPAWPGGPKEKPSGVERIIDSAETASCPAPGIGKAVRPGPPTASVAERAIRAACAALLEAEAKLTELDRVVGDGDLGSTLARGAKAIQESLPTYPLADLAATLQAIGRTLQSELGGSSGPLYGVLFLRCGRALPPNSRITTQDWAVALTSASEALTELGGARAQDRTMLDALIPFAATLASADEHSDQEAVRAALAAADHGAEATRGMLPRRGRSSYLGERALGHPDPGAVALTIWLRAAADAIFQ